MKYQLEYDKNLESKHLINYVEKNELLAGVSIWLRFSDVFENDRSVELPKINTVTNDSYYLSSMVNVSYDNQTKKFKFDINPDYDGTFEICGYAKTISADGSGLIYDGANIKKDEFDFIIEKYGSEFENDNGLQCLAYRTHLL